MIEPRLLAPLELPLAGIPPMALEVSDDEPVGIKIVEDLVALEDELLATSIGDWESIPVDDAAGVLED